ncbi:MAG: hypothetical protein R3F37_03530 [Candidatus Competibacteraceae bacterium]
MMVGLVVIHEQGVLLFDDWQVDELHVDELREEFRNVLGLLCEIEWVGAKLDEIVLERAKLYSSKRN